MSGNVEDLVVRAQIRDELSRPIDHIRDEIVGLRRETERLAGANDRANTSSSRFAGGLDRIRAAGQTARRVIGWTAAAVGAVATAAGLTGIKTAAAMQNAEIAFTTMLGSGKKAKKFIEELTAFAAKTPFDFPGLQTAAGQLIAAGIDSKNVIPIMTSLGDVTAGVGTGAEGIQRATNALQQMIAAQRITGEDLNQLRGAGIPVYDLLASALGKSKKEVADLAMNAKLGKPALDAMLRALTTGKGLERFNGLMAKQSKTLSGVWSTLKDNVDMGLARILKPAIPVLTALVNKLANAIPRIEKFFTNLREGRGGLKTAHDWIKRVVGAVGSLVKWMSDHKAAVIGFAATIGVLTTAVALFSLALSINPISLIVIAIAGFVGWMVHLYKTNDKAREKMDRIWSSTKRLAALVWSDLKPALDDATEAGKWLYEKALRPAGEWLGDHLPTAIDWAGKAWQLYIAYLGKVRDVTLWLLKNVLQPYTVFMLTHMVPATLTVAQTLLRMAAFGVDAFGKLLSFGLHAYEALLWGAEKAFGWIPGVGDKLRAAKDGFSAFVDGYLSGVGNVADGLRATADGLDTVKDASRRAGEALDQVGKKKVTPKVEVGFTAVGNAALADAYIASGGLNRALATSPTRRNKFDGMGDTASRRGWGGSAAGTLAAHAGVAAALGGGYRVTNVFTGGGGVGFGSGDHQAGRAVDVTGTNLAAYAAEARRRGGYAAIHGEGAGKHVHHVPAAGDTATPRRPGRGRGGAAIVVAEGAVQVKVVNPTADVDVERAVKKAWRELQRDLEELDD